VPLLKEETAVFKRNPVSKTSTYASKDQVIFHSLMVRCHPGIQTAVGHEVTIDHFLFQQAVQSLAFLHMLMNQFVGTTLMRQFRAPSSSNEGAPRPFLRWACNRGQTYFCATMLKFPRGFALIVNIQLEQLPATPVTRQAYNLLPSVLFCRVSDGNCD
jgi:hypothetical protein